MAIAPVNPNYKPPKRSIWSKIFSPLLTVVGAAAAPFTGGASLAPTIITGASTAANVAGSLADKPKGGKYEKTVSSPNDQEPSRVTAVAAPKQKPQSSSPLDKIASIAGMASTAYGLGQNVAGMFPGGTSSPLKGQQSLTQGPQGKTQPSLLGIQPKDTGQPSLMGQPSAGAAPDSKYDLTKEIMKRPELIESYIQQGEDALNDPQVIEAYGGPDGIAQLRDLFGQARRNRLGG